MAQALAVSTAMVYRLAADGALPHVRVGNAIRIHADDLKALGSRRLPTP